MDDKLMHIFIDDKQNYDLGKIILLVQKFGHP